MTVQRLSGIARDAFVGGDDELVEVLALIVRVVNEAVRKSGRSLASNFGSIACLRSGPVIGTPFAWRA